MRLLADESCDFSVVRALRGAGHDVIAVAELFPSLDDSLILDLALREQRVLLTEDKDFGQLVYANAQPSSGVIFIRYPANLRATLPNTVVTFIEKAEAQLTGSFVVLSPGRIRIGGSAG
jgi:predicted nuclease of predicted toxin-antitoxin system